MSAAVRLTRDGTDATTLRCQAVEIRDAKVARRLLALALVAEGKSRDVAAAVAGMDRQTLRDWVHRYNEHGVEGLADRKAKGRPPVLSQEQLEELASWVRQGPDPEKDGIVRWRLADLAVRISERFHVAVNEGGVGKMLRRLGFSHVSARPQHPRQDGEAVEAHKKNFAELVAAVIPGHAKGKPLEVWWQDEARVGQQGTLSYVWADKGTRPRRLKDTRYSWAYIFGAVCPARNVGAALVMPRANAAAMNKHFAEIATQVAPDSHAVLILDGAGWHQPGGELRVPDNISILHLPPYCPELNPVENIWQYLRQNYLSNIIFNDYNHIVEACCDAWNKLTTTTGKIREIATRSWATVNI
ncbi:MAG: IS630 family transposase [Alphaproteobacteria bacterium]